MTRQVKTRYPAVILKAIVVLNGERLDHMSQKERRENTHYEGDESPTVLNKQGLITPQREQLKQTHMHDGKIHCMKTHTHTHIYVIMTYG